MANFKMLAAVILVAGFTANSVNAQIITFDDIPVSGRDIVPVPDGYAGFNWQHLWVANFVNYGDTRGMVSSPNAGFLPSFEGASATISSSNSFNLISGHFMDWSPNAYIQVSAISADGTTVMKTSGPFDTHNNDALFTFDLYNIKSATITGYDGNPSDPSSSLAGYNVDNITVTAAVPEPEEWAMMAVTIPLVGWQVRRKQKRLVSNPS
jgi:hypothetical protein